MRPNNNNRSGDGTVFVYFPKCLHLLRYNRKSEWKIDFLSAAYIHQGGLVFAWFGCKALQKKKEEPCIRTEKCGDWRAIRGFPSPTT